MAIEKKVEVDRMDITIDDGGTASSTAGDAFLIGASQTWYGRLPNATVDDIHAISSTGTVTCVVAALLDDVG